MRKNYQKILCLLLALLMLTMVAVGCKQQQTQGPEATDTPQTSTTQKPTDAPVAEEKPFWEMLDSVSDTSELPTWEGKKLTLRVWRGHGTGNSIIWNAENNVVAAEVERVTGVKIDLENSFDNAGQDWETKLGLMAATNEYPELGNNPANIQMLIDADKIWDLTDLIPEYMPIYYNTIPDMQIYKDFWWKNRMVSGGGDRVYGLPNGNIRLTERTGIDMERLGRSSIPRDFTGNWAYFMVRDDLLKKLYPNAMTLVEMEDYYEEHGQFTMDQVFDTPIKSRADYIQFLYDLKDLIDREDIREGNRKISVGYAGTGGDAWGLVTITDAIISGRWGNNYATYYNKAEGRIKFMMDEPFMKESIREYVQLIWDGVLSKESLVDSQAITQEKVNNGLYAISTVSWVGPNRQVIEEKGVPWNYRRLNLQIPNDPDFLMVGDGLNPNAGFFVFKTVKEEDLPQLMRWAEYTTSAVGQMNRYWGPKSAGLFEEDGIYRKYIDPALESNMVYSEDNNAGMKYGLTMPIPDKDVNIMYPYFNSDIYMPRYMYREVGKSRFQATDYFNPAVLSNDWSFDFNMIDLPKSADFWHYQSDVTEAMTKFSSVWTQYNDMILKCLAATDDADFDKRYAEMLDFAHRNGCDEAGIAEVNAKFFEFNAGYEHLLKR